MWLKINAVLALLLPSLAMAACDPITTAQLAGNVVKAVAIESVEGDEEATDCAQEGMLACEQEWAGEGGVPQHVVDARAAFANYLNSASLEEGWTDLCSAANLGHPGAQLMMARAYREGWSPVRQNDIKAYTWYRLTIARGNHFARRELEDLVAGMPEEARTWAEIQTMNWRPDAAECDISRSDTASGI